MTGPDPIVGRYRLVSSEGFDDFLKCLGVGMVKRKLANSVTPVVEVGVDSSGKIQSTTNNCNPVLSLPFKTYFFSLSFLKS